MSPVAQALTVLGDAIRFIDSRRPDLRPALVGLLSEWAAARKIPALTLLEHVSPPSTERAAEVDREVDEVIASMFRSNG